VLQRILWFPNYEHFGFQGLHVANEGEDLSFGFQGLHVANEGEDLSFHLVEGSVPIRTSGLVR